MLIIVLFIFCITWYSCEYRNYSEVDMNRLYSDGDTEPDYKRNLVRLC